MRLYQWRSFGRPWPEFANDRLARHSQWEQLMNFSQNKSCRWKPVVPNWSESGSLSILIKPALPSQFSPLYELNIKNTASKVSTQTTRTAQQIINVAKVWLWSLQCILDHNHSCRTTAIWQSAIFASWEAVLRACSLCWLHLLSRYWALSANGPHLSSAIGSLWRKLVSPKNRGRALTEFLSRKENQFSSLNGAKF